MSNKIDWAKYVVETEKNVINKVCFFIAHFRQL